MNELALFAGAGGGILGGAILGWRTICAVELEPYPACVLCQRQNDGILPPFPIWNGDIRQFDGKRWRGRVDVVSGGFPCQDISSAGRGAGIDGERSGLWKEMFRIVCEVRPRFAFVENSPMLTARGLGRVLGDLAASGYNAEWMVLGADDLGAPHIRKRMWILAIDTAPPQELLSYADLSRVGRREQQPQGGQSAGHVADPHLPGCQKQRGSEPASEELATAECRSWWSSEPNVGRVADGVAARVDRLKAIGNGQVPLVAASAFLILYKQLTGKTYPETLFAQNKNI